MASQDLVALFLGLGLPGLFGIAFVEKFVPIVPSYVMLILLGMTVPDGFALLLATLATAAGSLCASLAWYGLGRGLGERRVATAVARFGKYVFFSPRAYASLAAAYRRNNFWVTLIGQTVPVARIYLALPAGVLGLRLTPFTQAAAIGIVVWNAPFLVIGYLLRETSHAQVDVSFWVSIALVATEVSVVVGIRLLTPGRRTRPSPDDDLSVGPTAHPPEAAFEHLSLGRIGSLEVRLATTRAEVRQAQRMRYRVFYEEMSTGSGRRSALFRRDTDAYDKICDHLLVVDHGVPKIQGPFGATRPKVVGTYRLLRGEIAVQHAG